MIHLRLFVTGRTVGAERARAALYDIERRLGGPRAVSIEVVDVLEHPERADRDHVFATPTLLRHDTGAQVRLFGDLSAPDRLLTALNLRELQLAETA